MAECNSRNPPQRRRLQLGGRVQGVGMRPFLCRLARELRLVGWVGNTPEGVVVEVEGSEAALTGFERRLRVEAPKQARIAAVISSPMEAKGTDAAFRVADSSTAGEAEPCAPPDLAPCPECLRELSDSADRRYRYPFLSCTACGPRYSILHALPFDRERTTMAEFVLCPACRAEYENPVDRRFHAQTTCCPECGPRVTLWDAAGRVLAGHDAAMCRTVELLREGRIVALKGVGGFQLLVDAGNQSAVARLRERKRRPSKPFALLADVAMAQAMCRLSDDEASLLGEAAAPIVVFERKVDPEIFSIASVVAPDLPWLGVMLPASPLHHLLLADFGAPLVATSGNRGGEPITTDNAEALARLSGIADAFLVHDRPVLRPLDDSVLRVVAGQPLMLRRARGYVPTPVDLSAPLPPLLALGGHLKNTVAVTKGRHAVLSQHLGDLDDALAEQQCATTLKELPALFGVEAQAAVCDGHPDYASSRLAETTGLPLQRVPHHYAHALAGMAEHGIQAPALAIAWDGIGVGDDGRLWGGEFLRIEANGYHRVASLRTLRLPGGETAAKEPRRVALAALHELGTAQGFSTAFTAAEHDALMRMLNRGINAPACSSVGRMFDAVASLLGLCQVNGYEGQAAMLLEAAASQARDSAQSGSGAAYDLPAWPLSPDENGLSRLDWRPWLQAMVAHHAQRPKDTNMLAFAFHAALADAALEVARQVCLETVVLCGGCFQNKLLLELCDERLSGNGFRVYWPQRIPPNDGGLALGQLLAAARQRQEH